MAIYQKVNGVWTVCQRPYVLVNGVWTGANAAYVRRSGTWTRGYVYDVTPPNPPEIDLSIVEGYAVVQGQKQLQSRWINVGVSIPGSANDPQVKLARILTTYAGKPPTTPLGGTYTSAPDSTWSDEPWSDWRYNDFGSHNDTTNVTVKQWPRNASAGTIIKGDTTYYFSGWSQDHKGNWSAAVNTSIHVPKDSVDYPRVIIKEARFQPNAAGSWAINAGGYTDGELLQASQPHSSVGVWFYGQQFSTSIGSQGKPTIRSAQIYIRRLNDDGNATANIYLGWTPYPSIGGLPAAGTALDKREVTKLGTLAKGQGAWFDLPASFWGDLAANVKGMCLDYKDPVKGVPYPADYSLVASVADNLRCGETHVVWEESL